MKILYIFPHPKINGGFFYRILSYPSLTLKQLAAITPDEHTVELLDERFKKINFSKSYDLVGITSFTYNAPRAYKLADKFRSIGTIVILGGYHPSALYEEAKKHADSVVIGEAELTLPQLLKDLEKGNLKPFYFSNKYVPANLIPPAVHHMSVDTPLIEPIQATRGCPNQCQFCAIRTIEGTHHRIRLVDKVIDELKSIKTRNLFFTDASLTTNPEYSKQLFNEMKPLNKKFDFCGNINILSKDDEFIKLAGEAGCSMIQIGFESVSQDSINMIRKNTNKVIDYAEAIKKINDHGIMVMGLFIFGFDTENTNIFYETLETINQLEIDRAYFFILTPFPGTILFKKLERENRIFTKDWSRYNGHKVVFFPKKMSSENLMEGTKFVTNEFHSLKNLIKRSFKDKKFSLNNFINRGIRDFSSKQFFKQLSDS